MDFRYLALLRKFEDATITIFTYNIFRYTAMTQKSSEKFYRLYYITIKVFLIFNRFLKNLFFSLQVLELGQNIIINI